ncbi:uncharacterized protein JCM6883_000202 [Sporobolomyces salmoneus]|uniref:uncharacterized protein n=1 Tax=Sporobolomyces salmoneus TaxID=183962 RepID=UPI00316E4BF4
MSTRDPSPAPRSRTTSRSSNPPPPFARSASLIAAPTLSRLTTRSSSASRLYHKDLLSPTQPSIGSGGFSSERTSLNGWRDKDLTTTKGDDRNSKKRKGKAVAFVVGISNSSGEEGDEGDSPKDSASQFASERGITAPGDELVIPWETTRQVDADPTVEEIIRSQVRQPVRTIDSLDFDSLLRFGIGDYSFVFSPPTSARSSLSNLAQSGDDDAVDDDGRERISLGKGKFSEVLLVRKGDAEFALKHTPLHPHHPLIANRLLREPTILAQLLPHPNLVKVFETIRTPGHFYLVEESLRSSITLESFVSSSPGGVLPLPIVWSILEQLSSVVRSLHEPLRVVHRDIKPENILVRVIPPPLDSPLNTHPTVVLKLLDFGLATHFSASEPKLTTCCGSPAYHSPELWKGLREASGTVPYWGPEIDIWCIGLTILRMLSPSKYPLGTSHASLQAISDKVVDALLAIRDSSIRQVLSGFLNLSGTKRIKSFERFCASLSRRSTSVNDRGEEEFATAREETGASRTKKEFKSTTFIPSDLTHRLELPLDTSFAATGGPKLEATVIEHDFPTPPTPASLDGRRTSLDRINYERRSASPHCGDSASSSSRSSSPQLSPAYGTTTLPPVASGMTAVASTSPPPLLTPDLAFQPVYFPQSLPPTPTVPSSELLPLRHLAYPPPIEITLLNPTNEPVRRAISYIKYSLRCAGILYHVRDDTLSPHTSSTPASPLFETPASLPPTPFTGTFNLPSSPELDDDTFCSYLQCVAKVPTSFDNGSKASSALLAALRPPLTRAHSTDNPLSKPSRSDSGTPSAALKLGQRKKEKVDALTFYLSIRKVYVAPSSSRHGNSRRNGSSTGPTRRRHSKDSRIVITLSDDRALSIVREALAYEPAASIVSPPPLVPVPDASGQPSSDRGCKEDRSALSPRPLHSGSRDARQRREDTLKRGGTGEVTSDFGSEAVGLKMDMGPRKSLDEGGGGIFDLAGFVGRLVGSGGK